MRTEQEIVDELDRATPVRGEHGAYQAYSGSTIAKYVMEWVLGERATPPSKVQSGSWT